MAFIPVALAAASSAVSSAAASLGLTTAAAGGAAAAAGLETASIPLAGYIAGTGAAAAVATAPSWLSIGSSVLSGAGALSGAKATSDAASYNAKVNDIQAKQAADQAAYAAGEEATKTRQRLAAQRAGAAQNGIDLSGSAIDIMDATAAQGGLNYLTAIYNGDVNSTSLQNDAKLNRARSSDATIGGYIGVGSSVLNGIADVYKRKGNALSIGGR